MRSANNTIIKFLAPLTLLALAIAAQAEAAGGEAARPAGGTGAAGEGRQQRPRFTPFSAENVAQHMGWSEVYPVSDKLNRTNTLILMPPNDQIKPIDNPQYTEAGEVDFLKPEDLVLAAKIGDAAYAYPIRVLDWHEVVNTEIVGVPVAVTYCPLCRSGSVLRREIDGETVKLGVSGMLHNSQVILFDEKTRTIWEQTGEALGGPRHGESLTALPMALVTWEDWSNANPGSQVLNLDTGFAIDYVKQNWNTRRGTEPWDESDSVRAPVDAQSDALHPKRLVYGFDLANGGSAAFTVDAYKRERGEELELAGRQYHVRLTEDGFAYLEDENSPDRIDAQPMFWFAWYARYPETELVQ